jgi:hypothetical protein
VSLSWASRLGAGPRGVVRQSPLTLQATGARYPRRNGDTGCKSSSTSCALYITGWLNYFGLSHSYRAVDELADWVRRRVRLYYWKTMEAARHAPTPPHRAGCRPRRSQDGHAQPQRLLADEFQPHCATSAQTTIWLEEQGCPKHAHLMDSDDTTGQKPESDRNRPVRTRTPGGVDRSNYSGDPIRHCG